MKRVYQVTWIAMAILALGLQLQGQETGQKAKQLKWIKFDETKFDKERFGRPIIIAFMKDICPGCKAKRDALWTHSKVTAAVSKRGILLFEGNAQVDKDLATSVKKKFKVDEFPVVIFVGKGMSDKPIFLHGIPEPEQVLKMLDKHLPLATAIK